MCFLEGNTPSRGKHYAKIVETLYLPEAGKQASAVGVDVAQDLF